MEILNFETKEKIESILSQSGLNWETETHEIQTVSGIVIPDKIALVRDDNQRVLGIHGKGYQPYQNHELLDLLYRISQQTGLELHKGGSFGGGEKVYLQLKSQDFRINNDTIKGYISGFNSFDGSSSLGFGNSTITVSCQNTFWMGYGQVKNKFRHSQSMMSRIEEHLRKIDTLLELEKLHFNNIERLGNIKLSKEVKDLVTQRLFDLTKEERLSPDEISTRKRNNMIKFEMDLLEQTSQKGDNLWGLFSGVTKYTTHSMKKGDNTEQKIFGVTGNRERVIWNELVEMV